MVQEVEERKLWFAREPGTAHHPPGTDTGQTEGIRAFFCIPFSHRNDYSLFQTIAVTLSNQKIQSTYFRVELTH